MPQYTMNTKYASQIAIDQHARSVTMRGLDLTSGEERARRLGGCPSAGDIAAWAEGWAAGPIRFAYESGPCGFHLTRGLQALGHACDVIAVSSIPRSPEDRYHKDDGGDAARLLSEMVSPATKAKAVWVPDEGLEGSRDLVRAYYDAVDACRRSKQRLSAFLMRHGRVWDERTASGRLKKTWTAGYIAWARATELDGQAARDAMSFYLKSALEDIERVRGIARLCGELAGSDRFRPYVEALTRLKGVEALTALTFAAAMGDFHRFRNGRSVSSYFGLTPRRHDSGERAGAGGRITKAGDTTVRRALIEALVGIGNFAPRAKELPKGAAPQTAAIEAEALKCNIRNAERYRALVARGKGANVAKVAVASELARQMWAIGRMVEEAMAKEA